MAKISPVFIKLGYYSKDNYRPISTLSNFTKRFQSILSTQLNRYMQDKFSQYLTCFRKNHNRKNSLLRMILIIMDWSKAFDSLNHELLLAKSKAYGLETDFKLCKINNSFSEWGKVLNSVSQGSILGPLLFNIFLNDIFLSLPKSDFANYADH